MKIAVDDLLIILQPDQVSWDPPIIVTRDGNNAPIYAPHWSCRIALSKMTETHHHEWFSLADGNTHTLRLPHPASGVLTDFTGYVDTVTGVFDTSRSCDAAMTGMDIQCSGILVSV